MTSGCGCIAPKFRHRRSTASSSGRTATVQIGATVTLIDEDTDEKATYQIVGADESDIKAGLLSITSPLARALIGKSIGDSIEVSAPSGMKSYEILSVAFK